MEGDTLTLGPDDYCGETLGTDTLAFTGDQMMVTLESDDCDARRIDIPDSGPVTRVTEAPSPSEAPNPTPEWRGRLSWRPAGAPARPTTRTNDHRSARQRGGGALRVRRPRRHGHGTR